jgi:hypothetical protein
VTTIHDPAEAARYHAVEHLDSVQSIAERLRISVNAGGPWGSPKLMESFYRFTDDALGLLQSAEAELGRLRASIGGRASDG